MQHAKPHLHSPALTNTEFRTSLASVFLEARSVRQLLHDETTATFSNDKIGCVHGTCSLHARWPHSRGTVSLLKEGRLNKFEGAL